MRCRNPLACLATLTVLAAAQTVQIRILDPHGLSVAGAAVELQQVRHSLTARSGADGAVSFQADLPAVVRVSAAGFETLTATVEAASTGPVELRLRPAIVRTWLEVLVRDEGAPGDASTGSALEIDRSGARTVLDAVEQLAPGAFLTRRGVMGYGIATNGTGQVSLRGVGGSPNTQVLVIIDGRPDFQGLMGHPLPDFYSLSDAAQVSVSQGPASVLYGSNAMGGVVEIEPARPREGVETRLSTSLGSYLTGLHRLWHGARFEKGFYSLTSGVAHTRGERASAAFRSQDASVALGYDFSPVWKASLQGRYGHFHVEDPGPLTAPLAGSYARVGRGGFSLNLDHAHTRRWGYARLYSAHGRHIITDGFRSVDRTTGVRLHESFALRPRLVAEAGGDVISYGGRARNVNSRLNYGEHGLETAAGFTRLQWTPDERTQLRAGLRYERHSLCGAVAVPEFHLSWNLTDRYTVAAGAARGFRHPTIRELYLFPAPNPRLQPEYLWNYQAALQARPRPGVAASLTAYYADLSNTIITLGRYPNLKLDNAGRALNRGLEAVGRWTARRSLRLQAGYGWLRSTNLPPLVPAQKWNYSLDWDAGRIFLHAGAMTVGRRWTDLNRNRRLGGYTVASLRCSVPLRRGWSVHGTVDNLLDRRYEVLPGYPMPGMNALGGVSWQF